MDNTKKLLKYLRKSELSAGAFIMYAYLFEHDPVKPPVSKIARDMEVNDAWVLKHMAELSSKSLLSGRPEQYHVHIPSLDKNAAMTKETTNTAILGLPQMVDLYYKMQKVSLGPQINPKRTSQDYAIMRQMCKRYEPKKVEKMMRQFFESGVFKDESPRGNMADFSKYFQRLYTSAGEYHS